MYKTIIKHITIQTFYTKYTIRLPKAINLLLILLFFHGGLDMIPPVLDLHAFGMDGQCQIAHVQAMVDLSGNHIDQNTVLWINFNAVFCLGKLFKYIEHVGGFLFFKLCSGKIKFDESGKGQSAIGVA